MNRRRPPNGGLGAGIAEHQPLIARALTQLVVISLVHALRNIRALLVVGDQHRATLVVDAVFGVVVTDALERFARHEDVIDIWAGGDLSCQHDEAGAATWRGGN